MPLTPEQKDLLGLELTAEERDYLVTTKIQRQQEQALIGLQMATEEMLKALDTQEPAYIALCSKAMLACIQAFERAYESLDKIINDYNDQP